jgi:hypothetical protein
VLWSPLEIAVPHLARVIQLLERALRSSSRLVADQATMYGWFATVSMVDPFWNTSARQV